ncbi:MAG: molybdopterin molybdenumtransferase MoeA [Firmicutes bacterium HGW-Firmicutes-20]|nr:MAG: molybdopterin molybdenumtransferase MoeA [Firmicutes bacterium HGW-Firmicutes-20]PKM88367.1 MAG: molybdopterin molybdenumtransferase MoeA [Firmicutes bacterium HGW-Firmicutes-10]
MKLLTVESVEQAILRCVLHIQKYHKIRTEIIPVSSAFQRISSKRLSSSEVLPNFNRSTVDGYALAAQQTFGASESIPTILTCIERLEMGQKPSKTLNSGECCYVPTGGMIPDGATAVVMVEYCEAFNENQILIYRPVAHHENVIFAGEDLNMNDIVIEEDETFTHQAIGRCAGVGISHVEVYSQLKAAVISTGDEVFPIDSIIKEAQVHDVNSAILASILKSINFEVIENHLIQDDEELLFTTVNRLRETVDMILISGGSSQGEKDYTAKIIDRCQNPGLWSHGLAIKPGKPTILGSSGPCLVVGLPGHPVSAMTVFLRVIKTAYQQAYNINRLPTFAVLDTNVMSSAGKETIIYVQLRNENKQIHAKVLYSKSGLISTLKDADGYVIIPGNLEGYQRDEVVEVILL